MSVRFSLLSWAEHFDLHAAGPTLLAKLNALIEEWRQHPFKATGKPEPLGGNLSGVWSRRIRHEYRVAGSGDTQVFNMAQRCPFH